MTAAVKVKGSQRTGVDWFLLVLRILLIAGITIGFVAFIAQQINPENPFAKWTHDGEAANALTGAALKGLFVSGLSTGAMYGLIALGYSMVYGVLGFINFAHGEVFMVGSFTAWITANQLDQRDMWSSSSGAFLFWLIVSVLLATIVSAATAVMMERVAYRKLRGAPRLIPLITSIGVSFFLQNASILLFGPGAKSYPKNPEWMRERRTFLEIETSKILVIIVAAIAMAGLWYFVERTKTGKAMRAVAEDKEIASLMGIDVNKTIVTTFAVGGAMAGVAGVLWGLLFPRVIATMGFLPGIKAFTAAVVGGVGNLGGAMAGGISLGSAEALAPLVLLAPLGIDGASQLKDAVSFVLLILVLMIKPTGLFGERLSSEDRA